MVYTEDTGKTGSMARWEERGIKIMPIDIHFADNRSGVVLIGSGSIVSKEFTETLVAFLEKEKQDLAAVRYWYSDYSQATPFDVTIPDLRRLADASLELARVNTTLIVAICASDKLVFGLSRMWEIFVDKAGWNIQVFGDQNSAKAWLCKMVEKDLTFN